MNLDVKIGCLVVLYNPNLELLNMVLNSVKPQVYSICIVDNSEKILDDENLSFLNFNYIKMEYNKGIASAQNEGIRYFQKIKDITHIFFLDQDSIIPDGLVKQLLSDLLYLKSKQILVGGIGSNPINRQTNKKYHRSYKRIHYDTMITETNEIMNSASLIPISHFREIGLMDDFLFIDGVDYEWCWRATFIKKLRFFISDNAYLSHQLGEGNKFFIYRDIAISSSFRIYYQFRNYFILVCRSYVPLYWKLTNGFKFFIKLFYYPIFVNPRKEYLKNIIKGIKDGIKNKYLKR